MRSLPVLLAITLYSFPLLASRMTVVRDECANRNWARTRCEFLASNPYDMDYRKEDDYTSRVVDLGGWLGTLTAQMDSLNNPELSCVADSGRLGRLTAYTRRIVERRPLSPCQKACVVKCITANYIVYQRSTAGGINQDSACQAANTGTGICRAYANLADHLMDELGLRSQSRAQASHAYNKIWLNNRWYYGEPQDPECRFFSR